MTTCPKCHRDTQSMAYHTCQVTEERVRSLIAEALTDKEEHIRRVVREEISNSLTKWVEAYTAKNGHPPLVEFDLDGWFGPSGKATFDKNEQPFGVDSRYNRCDCCGEMVDPMDSSWRHAGDHWQHRCKGVDAQAGHPGTATKANPSTATIFRPGDTFSTDGVAKINPANEVRFDKEVLGGPADLNHPIPVKPSTSPLREFVEAADRVRKIVPHYWNDDETKNYDTARSRVDVEEIDSIRSELDGLRAKVAEAERQRDGYIESWKKAESVLEKIHSKLQSEQEECAEYERTVAGIRSELEKANKALDEVAAWFGRGIDYTEGGFIQTWLESVGRLGGAK